MRARERALRPLRRALESAGWRWEKDASGHYCARPPRGCRCPDGTRAKPVRFALTPSDWRGDRNSFAELRRMGVDVPRRITT